MGAMADKDHSLENVRLSKTPDHDESKRMNKKVKKLNRLIAERVRLPVFDHGMDH